MSMLGVVSTKLYFCTRVIAYSVFARADISKYEGNGRPRLCHLSEGAKFLGAMLLELERCLVITGVFQLECSENALVPSECTTL